MEKKQSFFGSKKYIVAGIACFAFLAVSVSFYFSRFQPGDGQGVLAPSGVKSQEPAVRFAGFEEGTRVSYQVIPSSGEPESGTGVVDSSRLLELPAIDMKDPGVSSIAYNVVIDDRKKEEPLNIMVRLDRKSGKVGVSGSGLDNFADIIFEKGAAFLKTKSDWSGAFNELEAVRIEDMTGGKSFKLAFQSYNLESDSKPLQSPYIEVQVLENPGGKGGGPTSSGVNQFSAVGGSRNLSIYDTSAVNKAINKIKKNYIAALQLMTEQLSAVMMQYVQIIGSFLDAKFQLETQRKLQELQAEAHKEYHPSEQMCQFGTFVRSVAHTESRARLNAQALNKILVDFYRNTEDASSAEGFATEIEARLQQYREKYCNLKDNNQELNFICDHDGKAGGKAGGPDKERLNKDIDYARTLEHPLTLNVDFTSNNAGSAPKGEAAIEEDIIALAKNLYWPSVLETPPEKSLESDRKSYLHARQLIAVQSVAHNSYVNLVGLKSRAPDTQGADSGWAYMKALLREFGIPDKEIHALLGDMPSYYAQMEVLTKKMYQHPDFYTNLYDKPVNVDRIGTSMKAISLMQDRDLFESQLRREMLISLLVEQELKKQTKKINPFLFSGTKEQQAN